ncbi:MAG: DUF2892 domain-containing protein [Gammaproteobacteria bacterium]
MNKNVGSLDRGLRIVAGLVLLSLTVIGPKSLWGLIGIVPLFTALIGWCPAYTLFGIRTCKTAQ